MGATTSKVDGPLETLDAEQVHGVVAGFGTQFAGAADKMREAGIDGDYLAHAEDDDLAALDDVQLVARVALLEDGLAVGEVLEVEAAEERVARLGGELAEERDVEPGGACRTACLV